LHADELPRRHDSTVEGCIQLPDPPLEPYVLSPAAHKYTWCLSHHMAPGLISGRPGSVSRPPPPVFVCACIKPTTTDCVDTSYCPYEDTLTFIWLAAPLRAVPRRTQKCHFFSTPLHTDSGRVWRICGLYRICVRVYRGAMTAVVRRRCRIMSLRPADGGARP